MSASPKNKTKGSGLLRSGDRMAQEEFHRRYERCDEGFHAQLIDGTVFVREPAGTYHANYHVSIVTLLGIYQAATPGVEACSGATVLMGPKDEVEPDVLLRVLPEYGGQSSNVRKRKVYIQGAPELIIEVAHSTKAIDLNLKRQRYQCAGVIEYIVLCLEPAEIHWFDLHNHRKFTGDGNSIFRSTVFPGLWIHGEALAQKDGPLLLSTLNEGLATAEHAEFVRKLNAARK